jgi:putative ABC transport system permease protein
VLARYVLRDLLRNPRRTLAALVGVTLGVGLFSGVLFFVDGSGASMTKRAIAPLAIDMQRVIGTPAGHELRFDERVSPTGRLRPGQMATVVLTATNRSSAPANEVVIRDDPPSALKYVSGSARLGNRPLQNAHGGFPLASGPAALGLNLGTLAPGRTVRISYRVRATAAVVETRALPLHARISTREVPVPARPNARSQLTLRHLAAVVGGLRGVASADGLAFVDLKPASLTSGSRTVADSARIFGFDPAYARHYRSITIADGSLRRGTAALSAEAARKLGAHVGSRVTIRLPQGRTLSLPVSAIADLSRATALFYSRKASNLEEFRYVPASVVVDLATFMRLVVPAFSAGTAGYGSGAKTAPLLELDVRVQRSRLHADPGTALAQTQEIAQEVRRVAPGQDYLIDNVSNALQVARDDAAVAKRMFVFLGLPGALLAAFLAAYAGGVLAAAQRRELANLRIRGAHRGHLHRMLAYRTLALAGAGAVVGTAVGFASALAILGANNLFQASAGRLAASALVAIGIGLLTTGTALYLPGRRSLRREINQERGEMTLAPAPAWRRHGLDLAFLGLAIAGEAAAIATGAFDAPHGSVYLGRAVSLPSYLILAPIAVWIAGTLLCVRLFAAGAARIGVPAPPRFGAPVGGIILRTVRRRAWALAGGVTAVGLVVGFGTALAVFTATYDTAKTADSRFSLGSDLRVTPKALDRRPYPAAFAQRLAGPGIAAATPVVFKPGNSVLTSSFNEDQTSLAAVDPAGFARVAALSDLFFSTGSADQALTALTANQAGVLLQRDTADNLKIDPGDRVQVLFAAASPHQRTVAPRVLGLFDRLPGLPANTDILANLHYYNRITGLDRADSFLVRASQPGAAAVAQAVTTLRSGPAPKRAFGIDTTRTTYDKDQSSLTALNVHGLLRLDGIYTLLMGVAAIGIFVFGLMLQRRREYVTLRAQGLRAHELRLIILGEGAIVAVAGTVSGLLVGAATGYLLVRVLRPLFILDPGVSLAPVETLTLALLVLATALLASVGATAVISRLRPSELLREA